MELLVTNPKTQFDELSKQYLKQKESLITVIVDAKETAASVKRVWDEIQSQCEQHRMKHLEESANAKKYTVEVEALPQAINQSGTIVCGGGEMHIEVVEVPKKLSNQSGLCTKNIVESGSESKQCSVKTTKIQTSQATTVDSHDTLWGTPWTPSDNVINQVADQDMNLSSHSSITKTKPIQFSLVKDIELKEQTEENREGKIKSWCAPSSLLKSTESEPLVSWGTPWDPSQWWQTSYVGEKDVNTNRQTRFHDPNKKYCTLGKLLV